MGHRMVRHLVMAVVSVAPLSFGAEPASQPVPQAAALAGEVHAKGWIAYGAKTAKGDWDLFLCRPDGSDVQDITNTPEYSEGAPRFSPDGRKMLYRRYPKGAKIGHDQWGFQGELILANADGGGAAAVGGDGDYPWASWS